MKLNRFKLRHFAAFFTFLCVAFLPFIVHAANSETITLGLLPGGNPEIVKKQAVVLAQKLQDKLKQPVQIFISKDYKGLIEAINFKKVDFAFFSSMTFVVAEKETNMKVLLKKTWDGPYYYSALIVKKKSPIKKIGDLKDKRVAFVDENSTSGYLYPQVHLRKNKIAESTFKKVSYSGSHAKSVELLETDQVDVAAIFSNDEKGTKGAWTQFSKDKAAQFRTLWVSDPIPNDPIVVRTEFYTDNPKLTHEVMYLLIEIQNNLATRAEVNEVLGHGDLLPATTRQYEPVREMVNLLKSELKL